MEELRRVNIDEIAFEAPTEEIKALIRKRTLLESSVIFIGLSVFFGSMMFMSISALLGMLPFIAVPLLFYTVFSSEPEVRFCSIADHHSVSRENRNNEHIVTLRFDDTGEIVYHLNVKLHFTASGLIGKRVLLCRNSKTFHLYDPGLLSMPCPPVIQTRPAPQPVRQVPRFPYEEMPRFPDAEMPGLDFLDHAPAKVSLEKTSPKVSLVKMMPVRTAEVFQPAGVFAANPDCSADAPAKITTIDRLKFRPLPESVNRIVCRQLHGSTGRSVLVFFILGAFAFTPAFFLLRQPLEILRHLYIIVPACAGIAGLIFLLYKCFLGKLISDAFAINLSGLCVQITSVEQYPLCISFITDDTGQTVQDFHIHFSCCRQVLPGQTVLLVSSDDSTYSIHPIDQVF